MTPEVRCADRSGEQRGPSRLQAGVDRPAVDLYVGDRVAPRGRGGVRPFPPPHTVPTAMTPGHGGFTDRPASIHGSPASATPRRRQDKGSLVGGEFRCPVLAGDLQRCESRVPFTRPEGNRFRLDPAQLPASLLQPSSGQLGIPHREDPAGQAPRRHHAGAGSQPGVQVCVGPEILASDTQIGGDLGACLVRAWRR